MAKLTKNEIRETLRSKPQRTNKTIRRLNRVEQRYISSRIDVLEFRYLRLDEEDRIEIDDWFSSSFGSLDESLLMIQRNVDRNHVIRINQLERIDEVRRGIKFQDKRKP